MWGGRDEYGQSGFHTVNLRPTRVNFLHADLLGDGISNGWRQVYFGTPAGPPADEDIDADGQPNGAEELAGTHPLESASRFALGLDGWHALRWPFAVGRFYDLYYTADLRQPFLPWASGLATNRLDAGTNGFFQVRVHR